MAFHVTQCPGCESTFNTSTRLLESAAGRVRCGSCLTVFEAMQYFVDEDHDRSDEVAEDSVFVGNNPQDYFDPTNFLTRSALTDAMSDVASVDVEVEVEVPLAESDSEDIDSTEAAFSAAISLEKSGETESDIVPELVPGISLDVGSGLDSGIDTDTEPQGEQEPESAQFSTAELSPSERSDQNQEESDFYQAFTEAVEPLSAADEGLIPEPAADIPAPMAPESDDDFGSPESDSAAGQAEADT
ncbi:MAG: hypothetical protein IIC59_07385, partial [Proteobacteria bacterium]|nr:hypothetical protein [Pseudomonadota bacterium]